jgi:hypothetical protein
MSNQLHVNDEQLKSSDIRQLENADEIERFFAKLHYKVDERKPIPLETTSYANTQDLKMQIRHHEFIATDSVDEDIRIYLFEVRSVTAKLRNELARGFLKTNDTKVLLVLTEKYEELEFVYLERSDPQKTNRKGLNLKVSIRPIPLTVNRLNPDSLALRVLKRFTFTEEDSDYQWEKLRSAYLLAEWSEEYFNNRALFSDYYLKERLAKKEITPLWNEDVRPIGKEVFTHLTSARTKYTGKTEAVICQGLFEPLFTRLGFAFGSPPAASGSEHQADYLLYDPANKQQPIAAALTYVWNRNLDAVDESRDSETPDEIPGAIVVSLLERQVAPWVIVTNGKLWRLYSSTASNKATNYYEIDLEEAIFASDQITALKYWWLFFRREAFTGFLDELLKNSADYAKELGDRLKDRVFVEIFPQFAKGFIADMRAKGLSEAAIDLDTVFSGTMTFLYRLMFALYAESLELLPINEVQGYRDHSLYRMKREIADAGGTIHDEAPDKLRKHYTQTRTDLYTRLSELFGVIDAGSDALNMPTYNGGLFSTQSESGRFLAQYAIPDRYLALGLDRLTRDIDTKNQALVFIDFKSLGVRQLGSIYEGLLEFKLKIAAEELAVTKEKSKEVYQPASKVKKPLAILAKGDVYLENDKQERKATGSYYTPDYIVKYIVKHTVGPVLDRKFDELRPRLHQAQKGYRDYAKLAEARRKQLGKEESPTVYWNKPEMQQLVDDCLNVRVLDPAMGSGHFLVEVVDYISNRLIDFLNGWSENPVWHFIDQTRQDILDDMDRQHVSIDAERLTRVALLKRAVLKRCIYGVDMNAMAVELAKVSLWLDAFTLGAPLSFLDHHLKHGNSLIGARVADVDQALAGQQSLFSTNKFAGVMLATDLMRQVSYLSDNTVDQTRQSAQAYRNANDHLAPYKRMLDVYTSRWFGNTPVKGKKNAPDFDPTVEFLQHDATQAWLENPSDPNLNLPSSGELDAVKIADTALKAAKAKRFFHWELEFPEVFIAPSNSSSQDIQLNPNGGFDAVVGNPPYVRVQRIDHDVIDYLFERYQTSHKKIDISLSFLELGTIIKNSIGRAGFISSSQWISTDYGLAARRYFGGGRVVRIVDFGSLSVFEDASTYPAIFIFTENEKELFYFNIESLKEASLASLERMQPIKHSFSQLKDETWTLKNQLDLRFRIGVSHPKTRPLSEYGRFFIGALTGSDQVFVVYPDTITKYRLETDLLLPYAYRGEEVERYGQVSPEAKVIYPYIPGKNNEAILIEPKELKKKYPNTYFFLEQHKYTLMERFDSRRKYAEDHNWYCYLRPGSFNYIEPAKLIIRGVDKSSNVGLLTGKSAFNGANTPGFIFKEGLNTDFNFILAILNSNIISNYLVQVGPPKLNNYSRFNANNLNEIPIFSIDFTTHADERERLTQEAIGAYDLDDNTGVLRRVQDVLSTNQTDVVHDLLAHLAERMIELNKTKQAELKRFLTWLEDKLHIKPKNDGSTGIDSLTGKTDIQGYLGDYQKGETELSWGDFRYRLHQNRNRFAVSLGDIEGEIQIAYEQSLTTLLPIKQDLARTDTLIDKIVYRLYGLTDAEIELIERPQYEQALNEAKAQVVKDEKLNDDEKADKLAEAVLPLTKRYFERVEPHKDEAKLDAELPNWRKLPEVAQTFLLTGDYNLRSQPDHMDFSTSVVSYCKVVEVVLRERVFEPFRQQYTDADVTNKYFKDFMQGKHKLTLGNYNFIVPSSSEPSLRIFLGKLVTDLQSLIDAFKDQTKVDLRNKAAHAEVLTRDEAQQIRAWAVGILLLF